MMYFIIIIIIFAKKNKNMKLKGYSNYEIYPETGQVWSYKNNRYIGSYDKDGYLICCLVNDDGRKKMWSMHRLIWTVVNGEISNNMEVNHIDENKTNNSITNLSLMTHKENTNWGTRNERIIRNRTGKFKPKPVLALNGDKIFILFQSTRDAERHGYNSGEICKSCKSLVSKHKGYKWQYLTDYLADWLDNFQDECMKLEKTA